MHHLVSQFDLKPGVSRARFDAAWAAFGAHLIEMDLASQVGPIMARCPASGFDTDDVRSHALLSIIWFRDGDQADAAWAAIEARQAPMDGFHRDVFALVHDPVFTFWRDD